MQNDTLIESSNSQRFEAPQNNEDKIEYNVLIMFYSS